MIGKIACNYLSLKDKIKIGNFRKIDLDVKPFEICVIPRIGQLVSINSAPKCITVYDMKNNYELVKRVDKVNGYEINEFHMATNNLDKIFFSDFKKSKIILTDFDFNFIKDFGGSNELLDHPYGLLYHENNLYVCDGKNKRIISLDSNLNNYRVFCSLDFIPGQIKMLYFSACIKEFDSDRIYFYNTYSQSIEFDHLQACVTNGSICEFKRKTNFNFYISIANRVKNSLEIKFYNDYGEVDEGLNITNPYFEENGVNKIQMKLESFNQTLIVSLIESKQFLII